MLYTHYLISPENRAPYRELGSNITDEALSGFITERYSHFCENEDFSKEQFAIYTTQKEMTVGSINQLYLREKNRYVYMSHIYCVDMSEREKLLPLLPNIISTAEFESIPRQNPDLSATAIPYRPGDIVTLTYPQDVLKQLVQASIEVLLTGRHLFIVSGWEDCFDLKARDLMSQIVSLLPYQCRRRLNFCSYSNDIAAYADAGSVVFCRPQDALALQEKYGAQSVFYFLQQKLSFPSINICPFADFAVEHPDQIGEMLIYADRKLTGKLKNDPEFYDVLCHFKYVEKDESLDNYARHRAWLVPNLSQLYQLGIASRKKVLQLLENELHFEPDDSEVPFETKLSAFLYCYETGMVSKELMHDFLLHIRSCTDPLKWQLLARQLEIPIEEDLIQTPETAEPAAAEEITTPEPEVTAEQPQETSAQPEAEAETTEEPRAEAEEDEPVILMQSADFDLPDKEPTVSPDTESVELVAKLTEEVHALVEESAMAEASDEIQIAEPQIPQVPQLPKAEKVEKAEKPEKQPEVKKEKSSMLPDAVLEEFIQNLMKSANIFKYINAGCLYYNQPLYKEFYVQRAVAQYLSEAVACCNTTAELKMVLETADSIESYKTEAMTVIASEVRRLADEREKALREQEKLRRSDEHKQREDELLSEFDAVFASGDLSELERIDLIPRCIVANISKNAIDAYALKQYREYKNPLALMFLCCQYNMKGELLDCSPEKIEEHLHANIRAKELKYEWLNEIAQMPQLQRNTMFCNAIVQYAQSDEQVLADAKLKRDALYFLLVEKGVLKSSSRKYFMLGGLIIAAITMVTAAGVLLNYFDILG